MGRKLGGRCGAARSGARHLRRSGQGPSRPPRGQSLPGRCHSPQRAVAATHAGAVSGRHLAARTAIRRPARRMRVHVGPVGQGDRAAGRGDPRARRRSRPQPGRNPDVQHDDRDPRADRGRGGSETRRLCPAHQSGRRAYPDVRLDRRRFLVLRARPASPPRPERRRPHRDGQHHPRRSRPGLDRARGRRACRHRRHRTGCGRHARTGRRRDRSLVRADRCRRPERAVCGFARRFRGHHRYAGAGTDAARALQDRLSRRERCERSCSAPAAPASPRRIRPRSTVRIRSKAAE